MNQQTPDIQTIDGITYQLNSDIPYTGKHTMYYDNGLKFFEINYVNGKEHGQSISWNEDGQINYKEYSQDGLNHGPSTYWYDNNIICTKGQHYKGKKPGFGIVGIPMDTYHVKVYIKMAKDMAFGLIGILKKHLTMCLAQELKSK